MKKTTARKGKTAKPRLTLASVMDCVHETLRKHNGRLKELEHRSKTTDDNWANAVKGTMIRLDALERSHRVATLTNTDRKAASVEALNELRELVLKLEGFNNRNADAVRELRREVKALTPATAPVDVAALCKRHGLTEPDDSGWWHQYPKGSGKRSGLGYRFAVHPNGTWEYWEEPELTRLRDSGSFDTLAAALEKYCPLPTGYTPDEPMTAENMVYDAPPREPDATQDERRRECERRGLTHFHGPHHEYYAERLEGKPHALPLLGIAVGKDRNQIKTRTLAEFCSALDAVGLVAKPATADERAKLCEAWGLSDGDDKSDGCYNSEAHIMLPHNLCVNTVDGSWHCMGAKSGEGTDGTTTTLADLEAVFRKHLKYDNEWREKVAKEAGWYKCGGFAETYSPTQKPENHLPAVWANAGNGFAMGRPRPDRAAWLKFIRDNTPKVDPLDAPLTREAFDAEMASRGLDGSGGVWKIAKGVDVNKTVLSGFWADGNNPQRAAVWFGGSCWNPATLRELRAVLDANLPPLVGDGPWTERELEAAKIGAYPCAAFPGVFQISNSGANDPMRGMRFMPTREGLLNLAANPLTTPDLAARVRKALGVPTNCE